MLLDLTIRLFVDWLQSIDWSQGMPASCRNYEDGKDADVSCLPVLTQLRAEADSPARGFPWILLRAGGDDDAALSEWALAYHQWVFGVGVVGSTALLSWLCNLFTYYQHILRPVYQPPQCYLLRQLLCPLYPILDHLLARWCSVQVQVSIHVRIIDIPAELSARVRWRDVAGVDICERAHHGRRADRGAAGRGSRARVSPDAQTALWPDSR